MSPRLLPLLSLIPVGISAYAFQNPWFGALACLLYLAACGQSLGPRVAPRGHRMQQLGLGSMIIVASLSTLGSVVYYSATMTTTSLMVVLTVVAVIASLLAKPSSPANDASTPAVPSADRVVFSLGLLALAGWWISLLSTDIIEPIRSVWLALNPVSLTALGLATVCALTLALRNHTAQYTTLMLGAVLFSATAVAATVYHLGYGFDPFLHRATVSYIAEHGTITPKPLYYIGQYALELIGIKLFSFPLASLDAFLAPLFLSVGTVVALSYRQTATKAPLFLLVSLLFLPLSAFIQTTPQALAFVFTAWTLFVHARPRFVPLVFAVAAVITHPLAGIAALIYVALLFFDDVRDRSETLGRAGLLTVTLLAGVAVPIAFALQAKLANLALRFSPAGLLKFQHLPLTSFFGTQYNAWGDFAYTFIDNAFLIIVILAAIGVWLTPKKAAGWYIPGLVALAMFSNFVILSLGFDFDFLIAYERLDFALRLLTLTMLFLLPYVGVLLAVTWKKLSQAPLGLRLGTVFAIALVFISNVYGAYPRHDNYARSAGFNVGPADFNAVRLIEERAQGQDYIVLSDQGLAAAAIAELGFKKYYHENIFFYPIPTGGPLYQYFLTMVEEQPTLETMTEAMDLAGVNTAFFAVHNYWWQAPTIIENSKALTENWFAVDQGALTIFVFTR